MSADKQKLYIAVSGGVDSAAAASMLLQEGYDCTGVFMITPNQPGYAQRDAQKVCSRLKIKLDIIDMTDHFEKIIKYFCHEYSIARTPNPCLFCNRIIKFGALFDYAVNAGAQWFATGQYARIIKEEQGPAVYQALHKKKDQSYILSMINRQVLKKLILPMGQLTKEKARQICRDLDLGIDQKPESQEICFVPNDDHIAFLNEHSEKPGLPGDVVDTEGNYLGTHKGMNRYTIGQRRGLAIALSEPYYVTRIIADTNTIVLGKKSELMTDSLLAENANFIADCPAENFEALVKIRYNHNGAKARVQLIDKKAFKVKFDAPVSAVTPGQAAVIYLKNENGYKLIGGGWIKEERK